MSLETLVEVARTLAAETPGRKPPASLFLFTDPERLPDPLAAAARLPVGAAVVYRAFRAADALHTAQELRRITRERGLLLLVGADEDLALAAEADGVHLPERLLDEAEALAARRPAWRITGAAHSAAALQQAKALDAVMISSVFPSRSPSAGPALGLERFGELVRLSPAPVIALGGVNAKTAPLLRERARRAWRRWRR
jgi:thiamine-phosphate pyrophosphorylase